MAQTDVPALDAAETPGAESKPITVIEPRAPGVGPRLRDVWHSRSLLPYFARLALERRYRRTRLGPIWLVLRPAVQVLPGAFVFGSVLGVPGGGLPYFYFFLLGMAFWTAFERCLLWATRSLEMYRRLADRIAFPRLLLPLAAVSPALVEILFYGVTILIASFVLLMTDGHFYLVIGPGMLVALGALAVTVAFGIGIGLFTSVLNAKARDTRFTVQGLGQFVFMVTPVLYPLSAVPENLKPIMQLNPLTTLVEAFRWGLVGQGEVKALPIVMSLAFIAVVCAAGLWFFSRSENAAVDQI